MVKLLPFIDEFDFLQAQAADAGEGEAIHKYYGGIHKQLTELLQKMDVVPYYAAVVRLHSCPSLQV